MGYAEDYRTSLDAPQEFWLAAAQSIDWLKPPTRALAINGRRRTAGFPTV
jgi:propionyl-CoA synthetase